MRAHRILLLLLLIAALNLSGGLRVYADESFKLSFNFDSNGKFNKVSDVFMPVKAIGGDLPKTADNKPDSITKPEDVFVDAMDQIYIADTGNNRIVQFNKDGQFVRFIGNVEGNGKLKAPEGVFVNKDGVIYVADTGNARVAKYGRNGVFLREFLQPKAAILPKGYRFFPSKLVVDNRDIIYIVSKGSVYGMLQLNQEDEFLGFFGKNKVVLTAVEQLQKMFYTKEQREKMIDVLPGTITNATIDRDGFLFTATEKVTDQQIKKLNFQGLNILPEKDFKMPFRFTYTPGSGDNTYRDVAVDRNGMITAIDSLTNLIIQYDATGKLLFATGGNSDTPSLGILKSPSGIAVNSRGDLIVTDNVTHIVHMLRPTEFARNVLEATSLYQDGRYEDSEKPWKRVLELNSYYDRAHLGLAKAYFKKEHWADAYREFKYAGDSIGYSDTFWQIRMLWLQKHFSTLATSLLVFVIACLIIVRFLRRIRAKTSAIHEAASAIETLNNRWLWQLRQSWNLMKHPVLGYENLRDAKKGTWLFAVLLLIVALGCKLASEVLTSFIFSHQLFTQIDPIKSMLQFLVPVISWMICNYLVGTIYRGEGSFKLVCVGTSYALMPYVLFSIPIAALSNVLTLGEGVVYDFFHIIMIFWCCLLLIFKVQVIHNYDVPETVVNLLLSIFVMLILWVCAFILYSLTFELRDFIYQMVEELIYRA